MEDRRTLFWQCKIGSFRALNKLYMRRAVGLLLDALFVVRCGARMWTSCDTPVIAVLSKSLATIDTTHKTTNSTLDHRLYSSHSTITISIMASFSSSKVPHGSSFVISSSLTDVFCNNCMRLGVNPWSIYEIGFNRIQFSLYVAKTIKWRVVILLLSTAEWTWQLYLSAYSVQYF